MKKRFYSNGKLMLTGEYVALDGAKVLALPTRFGQDLTVSEGDGKTIRWKGFEEDGKIWYEDSLSFGEIHGEIPTESTVRNTLLKILKTAADMNPDFLSGNGFIVETRLNFPRLWGLGTSSTLLNNIADWAQIDPYELLRKSFGGSGYDIACARNDRPILFTASEPPIVQNADFNPLFADSLYFVYLNKKQSSKAAIEAYRAKRLAGMSQVISEIDGLTETIRTAQEMSVFADAIQRHENIISDLLEIPAVKQSLFPDFPGTLKSLGGWGGDFILAISSNNPIDYFTSKGFQTVIRYRDMIL